jgi:hypothetical protein
MMETLLHTAQRRDLPRLIERLEYATNSHRSDRAPLEAGEQLLDEALWYAKAGDIDEAIFRLRCRDEPKFRSVSTCNSAYEKAMAEKRARAIA